MSVDRPAGRVDPGPRVRTDVVDLYVLRPRGSSFDVLQLRRREPPLAGTWQPMMGHVEPGEKAVAALVREAWQELQLNPSDDAQCTEVFALEQVHPFFIAELDAIFLSPRFIAIVTADWEPALNQEHDASRWLAVESASDSFMWPGQRSALAEMRGLLEPSQSATRRALQVDRSSML